MSQQQQNPYAAQQTYTAVPGMGSSGPQQGAPQGGYSAQGAYQQYGQQDGYDTRPGGAGGVPVQQVVGMNGAGATDFWGELTATNASLNEMQDAIQQVRQAHVASLVSPPPPRRGSSPRPRDLVLIGICVCLSPVVVPIGYDPQLGRRPGDGPIDQLHPPTHRFQQEQDPGAEQARQGQDPETTGPGGQEPVRRVVARVSDGGEGI